MKAFQMPKTTPNPPLVEREQKQVSRTKLIEIKERIERQTGFPSELKVAKIILGSGWSYVANPRFRMQDELKEVDFIALDYVEPDGTWEFLDNGGISISVAIDVKHYSRPVVAFSSDWTDRDFNLTYSDATAVLGLGKAKTAPCLLPGLPEYLGLKQAGRSVLVVNKETGKANDFDVHQVSSAINALYKACHVIRQDAVGLHHRFGDVEKVGYVDIVIPVLVLDGELAQYHLGKRRRSLKFERCILLHNSLIGDTDRLDQSPAYLVKVEYLSVFLKQIRDWIKNMRSPFPRAVMRSLRRSVQS